MIEKLTCFKSYDVRGILGKEIDEDLFYQIGCAFSSVLHAKKVVVGRDNRESSPVLSSALIEGLMSQGVTVFDIGLSGTEEVYFATSYYNACGGLAVTASHNPIDFNGLKMVKAGSIPLKDKEEFLKIKNLVKNRKFHKKKIYGKSVNVSEEVRSSYVKKLSEFVDFSGKRNLNVIINSGNGAAGPTLDKLSDYLNLENKNINLIRMQHEPDSSFPNGIPNPLIPVNQKPTGEKIISEGADMGIAFDGDFDRCFFFDEEGRFIPGECVVGLLASYFLGRSKNQKIVHDARVVWSTEEIVKRHGGTPIQSITGHANLKKMMRLHNAIYGGEISGHHYFRDFYFCDSGMIPCLLVLSLLKKTNRQVSDIVKEMQDRFPSSGEINLEIFYPTKKLKEIKKFYLNKSEYFDESDGLSGYFKNWRFNVRKSQTESLLRLNVETKGDKKLLDEKVKELVCLLKN